MEKKETLYKKPEYKAGFLTKRSYVSRHRERNGLPSQTVPNETRSLKDLLIRHQRGERLDVIANVRQGTYNPVLDPNNIRDRDFDQPDLSQIGPSGKNPSSMDIVDIQEMQQAVTRQNAMDKAGRQAALERRRQEQEAQAAKEAAEKKAAPEPPKEPPKGSPAG